MFNAICLAALSSVHGRIGAAAPLALADQLPLLMIVKRGWSGFPVKVKVKVKKGIAVCRQACHHLYGNSHAICDHTVLPATRQR